MSEWATRSANRNLPRQPLISKKSVRCREKKRKEKKGRKKVSFFSFCIWFLIQNKNQKLKTKTRRERERERERERKRKERKSHFSPFFGDPKLTNSRGFEFDAKVSLEIGFQGLISERIRTGVEKMDHDETGCQAPPEGPILCINNCGFFGSAATMNMCSKCHKDMVLKEEQAKLAASSIGSIVNGSSSSNANESVAATVNVQVNTVEPKTISVQPLSFGSSLGENGEVKPKEGPKRCNSCNKRVGLTGFNCRCGNLFCAVHRYSDKHECPFDYRTAARDAIAKANPVVKAEKLDKI